MISGSGNGAGIAIGKVVVFAKKQLKVTKKQVIDSRSETDRLTRAVVVVREQLERVYQTALAELGASKAQIFATHLAFLEDPGYFGKVFEKIETENINAEWALKEETDLLADTFSKVGGDTIKERIADIRDVAARVTKALLGIDDADPAENFTCEGQAVVVADDLLPSEIVKLDFSKTAAVITQRGGLTSHTAIITKAQDIPAVMGISGMMSLVSNGDTVIVDSDNGLIYIRPSDGMIEEYRKKLEARRKANSAQPRHIGRKAVIFGGRPIQVEANITGSADIDSAIQKGCDGVGLFRSEFLYLERESLPGEEEQFSAYKNAVLKMQGLPLTIRTLDIGGDKQLPYLNPLPESNPSLGLRAIRICLQNTELFSTQLRAILRASAFGKIAVMFPMISSIEELRQAKHMLEEAKKSLIADQAAFSPDVPVGIMIETPAAALISDQLAHEADFFSIGTNDLIQYTVAVDRMSSQIAHLYTPYHPAVLRQIHMVCESAHKKSIPVAVCGEAAGDFRLIPALVGLGVDALSVSPGIIPKAKQVICSCSGRETEQLAKALLSMASAEEIENALKPLHSV